MIPNGKNRDRNLFGICLRIMHEPVRECWQHLCQLFDASHRPLAR